MTNTRFSLAAAFALGLFALSGCHSSQPHQVQIAGFDHSDQTTNIAEYQHRPLSVSVTNPAGGVVVIADDSLQAPRVQARTRGNLPAADLVSASLAGSALTIDRVGPDRQALVDITVWVPQSNGVTIRNNHGSARLVRVGGPIDVEVGSGPGSGGPIELRTQTPLRDGLRLVTTDGWIKAIAPALSAGQVEVRSDDGSVFVRSDRGELTAAQVGPGYQLGTLNTGGPAITMLTGRGDVNLDLIHTPFESGSWPKH